MKKIILAFSIFSLFLVYGADSKYPARLVKGKYGMELEINGKRCYPHAFRYLWGWCGIAA